MYKHIVMWRFRDYAEGRTKTENVQKAKFLLEGLKRKIREIKNLEVGVNQSNGPDSYDLVLCAEFRSLIDLEAYQNHPEHQQVSDYIGRVRQERRVVDYII